MDVLLIILLADQERLIKAVTGAEYKPGVTVRVAGGFEDALTGISGRGPFFFFIQERLGELSGELIAARLSAELKGRSARFFLLGDPDAAGDTFHGAVDESLPDDELSGEVSAIVSAPLPETRKRRRPAKRRAPDRSAAAESAPREDSGGAPDLPVAEVDDYVRISSPAVTHEETPADQKRAEDARFHALLENAMAAPASPEAQGDDPPGKNDSPSADISNGPAPPDTGKYAGAPALLRTGTRRKSWLILAGGLAVTAIILSLSLCRADRTDMTVKNGEKVAPFPSGEGQPVQAEPSRALKTLPSFVPSAAPEPGYGKSHPGWERFRGAGAEFRVFREKGLILAIQVLDRGGKGLPLGLFTSALSEIAGTPDYVVESVERKGGFVIEKGRLKNGVGVLIYRREAGRGLTGFVFDFR